MPPIVTYKNKYRKTAEELYQYLGKPDNYWHVYNCMTRFRITIKDKKQVNIDAIKKLNLIKDIHWNGNELQIIIGKEVIKIADELSRSTNSKKR